MVSVSIRPRKPRELEREIHQDSVSDNLEAEGRAIVDLRGVRADDESIEGLIDREISLMLERQRDFSINQPFNRFIIRSDTTLIDDGSAFGLQIVADAVLVDLTLKLAWLRSEERR